LPPSSGGWIPTLNNMGYMTERLQDPFSHAFVEFSTIAPGPSLDIGAAYGVATLEVLRRGGIAIANDLEEKHLEILASRTPRGLRKNLILRPGRFPDEIDFESGSLGAVLVSRVFHFFEGPLIERSARKIFSWLAEGGRVFVVAETPYTGYFIRYAPIYEERKKRGDRWPGFIEDLPKYNTSRETSLPPQMHVLDPEILTRVFHEAGFTVEKSEIFARPDFPPDIRLDGREGVGLIAVR
jgi:hypothetical protein